METIYRNTLEEDLYSAVAPDRKTAFGSSIQSAYWSLKNEAETDSNDVENLEFFEENAETIKELAQQVIDACNGKFVQEYKRKK